MTNEGGLHRYWFTFGPSSRSLGLGLTLGCGVTAFHYEDALHLLRERVFGGEDVAQIAQCIEDVDVSTLDANHVLSNMHPPHRRGVWFPLGYDGPP